VASVTTQHEDTETERIKVDRQEDDDTVLAKLGEIFPNLKEVRCRHFHQLEMLMLWFRKAKPTNYNKEVAVQR